MIMKRLGLYDLVRIRSRKMALGSIRDIEEGASGARIYHLITFSENEVTAGESDLEPLNASESPFDFYEVVTIEPDPKLSPDAVSLRGQRAVVDGIAVNEESGQWGFGVSLQNGEGWYFGAEELRHTGHRVPASVIEGQYTTVIARVAVNPKTGEGTLISGDPNFDKRRPPPLPVDLNGLGPPTV
jgi:hypothetical protein